MLDRAEGRGLIWKSALEFRQHTYCGDVVFIRYRRRQMYRQWPDTAWSHDEVGQQAAGLRA